MHRPPVMPGSGERTERMELVRMENRGRRRVRVPFAQDILWTAEVSVRTEHFRNGKKTGDGQCYGGSAGDGLLAPIGEALDVARETARAYRCTPTGWNHVELRLLAQASEVPRLPDGSPIPEDVFPARSGGAGRHGKPVPLAPVTIAEERLIWSSWLGDGDNSDLLNGFLAALAPHAVARENAPDIGPAAGPARTPGMA